MSLPHTTNLNTNSIKNTSYHLRPASIEDAHEIWTAMDICSKSMEQKDHFICDDLEYVQNILSRHGFGVVACDTDGKIVGNLLVKYPGLTEDNLGYDVFISHDKNTSSASSFKNQVSPKFRESDDKSFRYDSSLISEKSWESDDKSFIYDFSLISEKSQKSDDKSFRYDSSLISEKFQKSDDKSFRYDSSLISEKSWESDDKSFTHNIPLTSENLKCVVHMDSASVLPQHRGHGLEFEMIAFAENLIDTSNYCYSFATVAPENMASLKSLEKNGYQVMVTKEKYGGVTRCVMMKKL